MDYKPPYKITDLILKLISEISEWVGKYSVVSDSSVTPNLRRCNRIKTIHSSLAIENNTLSIEQVTAVIEGKRVLGDQREVQEVKNAFDVYAKLEEYDSSSFDNFLNAHKILMFGLVDNPGKLRSSSVGIARGKEIIHTAPPAGRVLYLMKDLFKWQENSKIHPLVSSSVFHYELEFIHPFKDGNGRMGRLWQTLILSQWKQLFLYLPIESIILENQDDYYNVLAVCDNKGDSTEFIEYMLGIILKTLKTVTFTPEVSHDVTPEVKRLISVVKNSMSRKEIQQKLKLKDEKNFRQKYLIPAIKERLIEMTVPEKPKSRLQKYRLTSKGKIV